MKILLKSHLDSYHYPKAVTLNGIKIGQFLCPKITEQQKKFPWHAFGFAWADHFELQKLTKGQSISPTCQHLMIRPIKTFWSPFSLDFASENVEIWPHQFWAYKLGCDYCLPVAESAQSYDSQVMGCVTALAFLWGTVCRNASTVGRLYMSAFFISLTQLFEVPSKSQVNFLQHFPLKKGRREDSSISMPW